MIGWIGANELAAHQITINLASISFMVVLGISQAASIRVGNAMGNKVFPKFVKQDLQELSLVLQQCFWQE